MSLGIIPGVNAPLLPDYVNEKSIGLASAYVSKVNYNNNGFLLFNQVN